MILDDSLTPGEVNPTSAQIPTPASTEAATEGVTAPTPAASTPPTEQPPPTAATAPAPVATAPSTTAPNTTEKKKIQLNPTVDPAKFRPVPTHASSTGAVPVPPPASAEAQGSENATVLESAAVAQTAALTTPPPPPGTRTDIPTAGPLEAGLEAEINAAMEGSLAAAPAQGAQATPSSQAEPLPATEDLLEPNTRLKAKVQAITVENVFCDVGYRSSGVITIIQFPDGKKPRIGEEFLVFVEKYDSENGVIVCNLPKSTRRGKGSWDDLAVGQICECLVNKSNKGGLEVTVRGLRAFLPASQVDLGFAPPLDSFVGKKFDVQVTEVNPAKRNLVVSRRVLQIQERKEASAKFWEQADVGQQFSGRVKTIKDYGAFVDIGGVDGFVHVGEISWSRVKHPSDVISEGQGVDVVILTLDREKQKIGLGMRQLVQNPWANAADKYAQGKTVSGTVTRITDFGAFVLLEPSIEGMIHISELDHQRVRKVSDVLQIGAEIQAQVLEADPSRQRISLSLKALKAKPVVEEPPEEIKPIERRRKEPLRGGTGLQGGGGMFGNPTDFK